VETARSCSSAGAGGVHLRSSELPVHLGLLLHPYLFIFKSCSTTIRFYSPGFFEIHFSALSLFSELRVLFLLWLL
jgi:hypothetical protein